VDQGGEPHTFTEVKHFSGVFIPGLNAPKEDNGSRMCRRLFKRRGGKDSNPSSSTVQIKDLSEGKHLFQCCIHPWMRVKVEVK
jgi:hypothetical protein